VVGVDDDDWFERALRDDSDEATASEGDDRDSDGDRHRSEEDPHRPDEDGAASETPGEDPLAASDAGDAERESAALGSVDPFGGVRDDDAGEDDRTATATASGEDATETDAAETAPSRSEVRANRGGAPEFDPPDAGSDGDLWGDFAADLERAPDLPPDVASDDDGVEAEFANPVGGPTGDFGVEGPAGDGSNPFDDEEFESEIDRLDIGIDGLDEMILGGVPTRSLMVAIGSAGTGKTTFGLQFLNHALERGESAVFITLEETRERLLDTAAEKGWQFRAYESEGTLAVVDLDPVEMANSLESIQNDLPRLVREFGADRLVLDSVSLLEMMYDDPSKRRTHVFNFARSLKEAGVTTMLTSEASDDNPYVSRHGVVEYLADAVFILQYVRSDDFRETRLAVEIQKIRDANHSRAMKPYELTREGISVYGQANIF
jgi:KaiC domain protein